MSEQKTTSFSSKIGLILAAAGGAVGLGNIWKFPYIAGENGGGAFLIVYLLCVVLFGLPLVLTEFYIGKRARSSAYGAFHTLSGSKGWQWLSWLSMLTAFVIMSFYFVVTGWCFNYFFEALTNTFHGMDAAALTSHFDEVVAAPWRQIVFSLLPVVLTASVLWFDVNKGIERLSKILLPLLLLMMLLMAGRVLMLDGSNIGMRFFFQTDFSKITPSVILEAMGQCFFSLSIGMGALITYGAYMPKNQNVAATSIQVIVLDTLVAVLAGIIIFPAVFAFGFSPAEGPQLVFVVLPEVFEQMSFSWFCAVVFFALLCIAAITSTISLMEVAVAFICEASSKPLGRSVKAHPLNRHRSVLLVSALVCVMVVLCVMSYTGSWPWLKLFGNDLFSAFDQLSSCVMMPLGALGMALFVGWYMPLKGEKSFFSNQGLRHVGTQVFLLVLRWLVPVAIILIFLNSLGLLDS